MTTTEADEYRNNSNLALAKHGTLTLTVKLETAAQADELMVWMYGSNKPMSSELVSIGWDCTVITKAQAASLLSMLGSFGIK